MLKIKFIFIGLNLIGEVFRFSKNKKYIIYTLLFIASIIPFFINSTNNKIQVGKKELFNHKLSDKNSVEKAIHYIDSIYLLNHIETFDTALYVQTVSAVVKERFYKGLALYSVSENWISSIVGKLIWSHLSAIVAPDDILKHSGALCSQQSIVFMEILKKKGIKVRSIGLGYKEGPGHFLSEVYYNGDWHLHDVTYEPLWEKISISHKSINYYSSHRDSLFLIYENKIPKDVFYKIIEKIEYGKENEFPAKNMLLFHKVTKFFTYILPVFFLYLSIYFYRKNKTH